MIGKTGMNVPAFKGWINTEQIVKDGDSEKFVPCCFNTEDVFCISKPEKDKVEILTDTGVKLTLKNAKPLEEIQEKIANLNEIACKRRGALAEDGRMTSHFVAVLNQKD